MIKAIWIAVLSWIERTYVNSEKENASQVVDCCLYIKEVLSRVK